MRDHLATYIYNDIHHASGIPNMKLFSNERGLGLNRGARVVKI